MTYNSWSALLSCLSKLFMLVLAYFTPIREIIHVMLIFILMDAVTGIVASVKAGNKVESRKLRKTVYKFVWYTFAVMAAYMMETTFKLGWSHLGSLTGGAICLVELVSMFENISTITGEPVFLRLAKYFKKKAASSIEGMAEDVTQVISNPPKSKDDGSNTQHPDSV